MKKTVFCAIFGVFSIFQINAQEVPNQEDKNAQSIVVKPESGMPDKFDTQEEKVAWIEENPELYQKELDKLKENKSQLTEEETSSTSDEKVSKTVETESLVNPEFTNSDEKSNWIKENPEEYQKELEKLKNNKRAENSKGSEKLEEPKDNIQLITTDDIKTLEEEIIKNENNPDYDIELKREKLRLARQNEKN